jgi:hypothetical protein
MTPEEICTAYWAGKIVARKIVWGYPSIATFFAERGMEMSQVYPLVGNGVIHAACGGCGKEDLSFTARSRTGLVKLAKEVLNGQGRCKECSEKEQTARVAAEKAAADAAAAEKAAELEVYRKSLVLKHGVLMTDAICPECMDGFLVVRLNSTAMKPFLSCSRFNPHRWTCTHTQSLAPEFHEDYLEIFRARLIEKEEAS